MIFLIRKIEFLLKPSKGSLGRIRSKSSPECGTSPFVICLPSVYPHLPRFSLTFLPWKAPGCLAFLTLSILAPTSPSSTDWCLVTAPYPVHLSSSVGFSTPPARKSHSGAFKKYPNPDFTLRKSDFIDVENEVWASGFLRTCLNRCFSNFPVCTTPWGTLFKADSDSAGPRGPEVFCVSNQLPGEPEAADPQPAFWVARAWNGKFQNNMPPFLQDLLGPLSHWSPLAALPSCAWPSDFLAFPIPIKLPQIFNAIIWW